MSLENSHVVVVGGGSGIGRAVTEALVSRKARVTISSRNAGKLNNVASALAL